MKLEYLEPPAHLKPEAVLESPYYRARREWDSRLGSARRQAANWRGAFFGILLLSTALTFGTVYQISKHTVVPMVIETSLDTGRTVIVGKVGIINYEPKFAQVQYFLQNFVRDVREVILDPVVLKQRWENAYFYLRQRAANTLNAEANRAGSPLGKIGKTLISVEPINVTQVGGGDSFQVRWRESVYDGQGNLVENYTMSGVFTLGFETPDSEEAITKNPLGIYIESFNWAREL